MFLRASETHFAFREAYKSARSILSGGIMIKISPTQFRMRTTKTFIESCQKTCLYLTKSISLHIHKGKATKPKLLVSSFLSLWIDGPVLCWCGKLKICLYNVFMWRLNELNNQVVGFRPLVELI